MTHKCCKSTLNAGPKSCVRGMQPELTLNSTFTPILHNFCITQSSIIKLEATKGATVFVKCRPSNHSLHCRNVCTNFAYNLIASITSTQFEGSSFPLLTFSLAKSATTSNTTSLKPPMFRISPPASGA